MKTARIIRTGDHKKRLIVYRLLVYSLSLVLLLPVALMAANVPSIEDVVAGKAVPPTIEDLTGGKVKNTDLIDKNNVDLVKEYLSAGMYEFIKRGMVLKIGTQLPPDQLNPKPFRETTERNRGKAVIDENGVVYYEKKGTPWAGGIPFPNAKTGLEAISNMYYGYIWDSWRAINEMWYVNSRGEVYKTVGQELRFVKCTGRTTLPPLGVLPGYENLLTKRIAVTTYPREITGLGQFTVRYYDFAKTYDTGFAYLPAFKRTIRVSATTWQDNIAGSDMTYGDGFGFQEIPSDHHMKLLGKKWLLVTEPKSPTPLHDEKGNLSKNIQFDVGKKYPRLGWVIWPVDVVEAIPKIKHVYGKRIIYMPVWPYIFSGDAVAATDIYDRQMKLWKGAVLQYGRVDYLDGDPQKPQTGCINLTMQDLQSDHTTHYTMYQLVNYPYYPEEINLGKMLQIGR